MSLSGHNAKSLEEEIDALTMVGAVKTRGRFVLWGS